jgi:hypothetical protein
MLFESSAALLPPKENSSSRRAVTHSNTVFELLWVLELTNRVREVGDNLRSSTLDATPELYLSSSDSTSFAVCCGDSFVTQRRHERKA